MMELACTAAVDVIPAGPRLRLRFANGATGVADLAPLVVMGGVFAALATAPETLALAPGGRAVVWRDADGEEADMDADTLRRKIVAERAAAK